MNARLAYEAIDGWPHLFGRPLFGGSDRTLIDVIGAMARGGRVQVVATPNVDQLLLAAGDPEARRILESADLLLADGAPLVALAKLLGCEALPRHTGADLLPAVAALSAERGLRVAIIGGAPGRSEQAATRLSELHPGASVTAVPFPELASSTAAEQEEAVTTLGGLAPHIVFVCLGFPRQELWVQEWRDRLPPAVYIGAGAAVDFAAGAVSRAPAAAQRIGMEWLWRLVHEPRRLAYRYLVRGPRYLAICWEAGRAQRRAA